jgi:mono/diheme cytochrome c family protein
VGKHKPKPASSKLICSIAQPHPTKPARHEKISLVIAHVKHLLPLTILLLAVFAVTPARAASKTKADEEAGAVLFRDKGCSYCHGANGTGGKKGPNLSNIRTDKLWTPAKITSQILNGGQKMPPFSDSLTDAEIAQLVAYLRAKQRPIPPPAAAPPPSPTN